jgi:hypothetical protein
MGTNSIDIPQIIRDRGAANKNKRGAINEDEPFIRKNRRSVEDHEKIQNIKDREADRELRKDYARKAFKFACYGFVFWVIVIAVHATIFFFSEKKVLSDEVLIAITTATTINLFAAFVGVIRGLFPAIKNGKG